jgi:hypothetical protein
VRKDIAIAHLDQCQFDVVGMGAEVFQCMQALSETAEGFSKVFIFAFEEAMTVGVHSTMVNTAFEAVLDEGGAGGPISSAVGNVVFHTGLRIDLKLDIAGWRTKASIVLPSIFIVVVVLRIAVDYQDPSRNKTRDVLDMLFWPVDTQSLRRNFKLGGCVSETEER